MQKIKLFVLFALVVGMGVAVSAQDTVYPKYVMRYLTGPACYGRSASYRGDSLAAKFLRKELQHLGVQPLADNYYQHYTYPTHGMEGPCRMVVNNKSLRPYYDFRAMTFSADYHQVLGITPIVRVPAETLVDSLALRKFLKKNAKSIANAVLYIDVADIPTSSEAEAQRYGKAVHDLYLRNPYGSKVLVLGVKELSAFAFGHADKNYDYALVEVLADKMPSKVKDINIDVSSQYYANYHTQNVCGIVPGRSDSIIVFTAHYDHMGQMGDSCIFYGTHDNASGVSAVMELARQAIIDTPKYTTVFLFFSGEEAGLYGSRYAAAHPVIDFSRVKLLINIDMFCGGDEGLMIFNAKSDNTKPYVERLQRLNDVLQICPKLELRNNRPNSDHYSFKDLCPSLFVLTMGGPYGGYHSPEDKLEGCGLKNFANYLTFIYSLAL
jgi:aminopeptidase YwaD